MSDEEKQQKSDELGRLLEQIQKADSFESVALAERIKTLAREVLTNEQPKRQPTSAR